MFNYTPPLNAIYTLEVVLIFGYTPGHYYFWVALQFCFAYNYFKWGENFY